MSKPAKRFCPWCGCDLWTDRCRHFTEPERREFVEGPEAGELAALSARLALVEKKLQGMGKP
jgi:hypothetical protein